MMFFGDGQFPRCGQVIRSRIVGLKPSTKVYSALVECIESEALAAQAVSAGTYPRVIIAKLMKNGHWQRNVGGQYAGECDPTAINYVYINLNVARGLEDDESQARVFARTVLHEVVHWGRFMAKKPSRIGDKEAGSWFEHRAYNLPYIGHDDPQCP